METIQEVMKTFWRVVAVIAILVGVFFSGWILRPEKKIIHEVRYDTIIRIDTIRDTVLVPQRVYLARVDTVFLRLAGDTIQVEVEVPIERKIFKTPDYCATIEGFRPELVSMEIYRQTQVITNTERIHIPDKRRWGLGVHVGYGATVNQSKVTLRPYVGVGVSYNLVRW